MKKFKILFLLILISNFAISQVGIGTTTPHSSSILDLTSTNKGLLLPRVANTAAITSPTNGMMIYDLSSNCVKGYQNGAWSSCISSSGSSSLVVVDCNKTTFNGAYFRSTAMNSNNTFNVTIINYGTTTANLTFATTDLVLTGANAGLSVGTVSPSSVALASGASTTVTYTLSGNNTTTTGTLTGTWTKTGMTCTKTVEMKTLSITSPLGCDRSINNGNLIVGTNHTSGITSIISYSSSTGAAIPAAVPIPSTGVTGLTATLTTTGNLASGGGTLTYTITGTPTTIGYAYFSIDIGGQTCTLTRTVSANLATIPATITLSSNITILLESTYDTDFLPYNEPTGPATLGSKPADGVNESVTLNKRKNMQNDASNRRWHISVKIPVVATGSGTLNAYNSFTNSGHIVIPGEFTGGGTSQRVRFMWDTQAYTATTRFIEAKIVSNESSGWSFVGLDCNTGVGDDYLGLLVQSIVYPKDSYGNLGNADLRVVAGIPDKMFNVSYTNNNTNNTYDRYVYAPVVGEDGKIWLSANLGAEYAEYTILPSGLHLSGYFENFGKYYQWGRKPYGSNVKAVWDGSNYVPSTSISASTTTKSDDAANPIGVQSLIRVNGDWRITPDSNLWAGEDSPNNPCPKGFRVPTLTEFLQYFLAANIKNASDATDSLLQFPYAGYRTGSNTTFTNTQPVTTATMQYWTANVSGTSAVVAQIPSTGTSTITSGTTAVRASSLPLRCIKD